MIFAILISIILYLFADFAYTNQMLLGTAIVVFLAVLYFFNSKIANWFVGITLFFGNFGLVTLLPFGSSFQINNFIIFDAFCTPLFIIYILINDEDVFSFVRWITYNDSN
jgi:hypothetical protein